MISTIIRWSLHHRTLVLCFSIFFFALGLYSSQKISFIAVQDVTDLQVIVKTSYPGQPPEIVEQQITFPISNAMLSVPKAIKVKGYSLYGDSYIYVNFKNNVDMYWARARVYEIVNQIKAQLPKSAKPEVGPDGTRAGWVYEYALIDKTGQHNLAELRFIHDRYIKPELQTVLGVSEVATLGGMVKQFQIIVDPNRLRAYSISINKVIESVKRASQDVGGSVVEIAEAEYMVRSQNGIKKISDIESIPLNIGNEGTPIILRDVASVRVGPQMRRGIAELNGEGEVVGGIVIIRKGGDELSTIVSIKHKIEEMKTGLPSGVEIIETYDRSKLIERSHKNIFILFLIAMTAISIICLVLNIHSLFMILFTSSLGILLTSMVVYYQELSVSIVTLSGVLIGLIIVIDSLFIAFYKAHQSVYEKDSDIDKLEVIEKSFSGSSSPILFSCFIKAAILLIIFTNDSVEKTYGIFATTLVYMMIASIVMHMTLLPVLTYYLSGIFLNISPRKPNLKTVDFFISWACNHSVSILLIFTFVIISVVFPLNHLETMDNLPTDEGDLIYSPTLLSGISIGKAGELLQITNQIIREVPEVKTVFGKIGRAESATDAMSLSKIETVILLHPKKAWRDGLTLDNIKKILNKKLEIPGVINNWSMPIESYNKINTGNMATEFGLKVMGADSVVIRQISTEIKQVLKNIPRVSLAIDKNTTKSRYINIKINRRSAARYGLNIVDVQDIISHAVGGENIISTIKGLEKIPVNIRFPQSERNSILKLKLIPIISPDGIHMTLGDVTEIEIADGPNRILSENSKKFTWLIFNVNHEKLEDTMSMTKSLIEKRVNLPPGYTLTWSNPVRSVVELDKFLLYLLLSMVIIILLTYIYFNSLVLALVSSIMCLITMVGAIWAVYILGFAISIPSVIGVLLIGGVSLGFYVVIMAYAKQPLILNQSKDDFTLKSEFNFNLPIRPLILSITSIIAVLLPIIMTKESGLEVIQNIAAPMIGGAVFILLNFILLIPVLHELWQRNKFDISRG